MKNMCDILSNRYTTKTLEEVGPSFLYNLSRQGIDIKFDYEFEKLVSKLSNNIDENKKITNNIILDDKVLDAVLNQKEKNKLRNQLNSSFGTPSYIDKITRIQNVTNFNYIDNHKILLGNFSELNTSKIKSYIFDDYDRNFIFSSFTYLYNKNKKELLETTNNLTNQSRVEDIINGLVLSQNDEARISLLISDIEEQTGIQIEALDDQEFNDTLASFLLDTNIQREKIKETVNNKNAFVRGRKIYIRKKMFNRKGNVVVHELLHFPIYYIFHNDKKSFNEIKDWLKNTFGELYDKIYEESLLEYGQDNIDDVEQEVVVSILTHMFKLNYIPKSEKWFDKLVELFKRIINILFGIDFRKSVIVPIDTDDEFINQKLKDIANMFNDKKIVGAYNVSIDNAIYFNSDPILKTLLNEVSKHLYENINNKTVSLYKKLNMIIENKTGPGDIIDTKQSIMNDLSKTILLINDAKEMNALLGIRGYLTSFHSFKKALLRLSNPSVINDAEYKYIFDRILENIANKSEEVVYPKLMDLEKNKAYVRIKSLIYELFKIRLYSAVKFVNTKTYSEETFHFVNRTVKKEEGHKVIDKFNFLEQSVNEPIQLKLKVQYGYQIVDFSADVNRYKSLSVLYIILNIMKRVTNKNEQTLPFYTDIVSRVEKTYDLFIGEQTKWQDAQDFSYLPFAFDYQELDKIASDIVQSVPDTDDLKMFMLILLDTIYVDNTIRKSVTSIREKNIPQDNRDFNLLRSLHYLLHEKTSHIWSNNSKFKDQFKINIIKRIKDIIFQKDGKFSLIRTPFDYILFNRQDELFYKGINDPIYGFEFGPKLIHLINAINETIESVNSLDEENKKLSTYVATLKTHLETIKKNIIEILSKVGLSALLVDYIYYNRPAKISDKILNIPYDDKKHKNLLLSLHVYLMNVLLDHMLNFERGENIQPLLYYAYVVHNIDNTGEKLFDFLDELLHIKEYDKNSGEEVYLVDVLHNPKKYKIDGNDLVTRFFQLWEKYKSDQSKQINLDKVLKEYNEHNNKAYSDNRKIIIMFRNVFYDNAKIESYSDILLFLVPKIETASSVKHNVNIPYFIEEVYPFNPYIIDIISKTDFNKYDYDYTSILVEATNFLSASSKSSIIFLLNLLLVSKDSTKQYAENNEDIKRILYLLSGNKKETSYDILDIIIYDNIVFALLNKITGQKLKDYDLYFLIYKLYKHLLESHTDFLNDEKQIKDLLTSKGVEYLELWRWDIINKVIPDAVSKFINDEEVKFILNESEATISAEQLITILLEPTKIEPSLPENTSSVILSQQIVTHDINNRVIPGGNRYLKLDYVLKETKRNIITQMFNLFSKYPANELINNIKEDILNKYFIDVNKNEINILELITHPLLSDKELDTIFEVLMKDENLKKLIDKLYNIEIEIYKNQRHIDGVYSIANNYYNILSSEEFNKDNSFRFYYAMIVFNSEKLAPSGDVSRIRMRYDLADSTYDFLNKIEIGDQKKISSHSAFNRWIHNQKNNNTTVQNYNNKTTSLSMHKTDKEALSKFVLAIIQNVSASNKFNHKEALAQLEELMEMPFNNGTRALATHLKNELQETIRTIEELYFEKLLEKGTLKIFEDIILEKIIDGMISENNSVDYFAFFKDIYETFFTKKGKPLSSIFNDNDMARLKSIYNADAIDNINKIIDKLKKVTLMKEGETELDIQDIKNFVKLLFKVLRVEFENGKVVDLFSNIKRVIDNFDLTANQLSDKELLEKVQYFYLGLSIIKESLDYLLYDGLVSYEILNNIYNEIFTEKVDDRSPKKINPNYENKMFLLIRSNIDRHRANIFFIYYENIEGSHDDIETARIKRFNFIERMAKQIYDNVYGGLKLRFGHSSLLIQTLNENTQIKQNIVFLTALIVNPGIRKKISEGKDEQSQQTTTLEKYNKKIVNEMNNLGKKELENILLDYYKNFIDNKSKRLEKLINTKEQMEKRNEEIDNELKQLAKESEQIDNKLNQTSDEKEKKKLIKDKKNVDNKILNLKEERDKNEKKIEEIKEHYEKTNILLSYYSAEGMKRELLKDKENIEIEINKIINEINEKFKNKEYVMNEQDKKEIKKIVEEKLEQLKNAENKYIILKEETYYNTIVSKIVKQTYKPGFVFNINPAFNRQFIPVFYFLKTNEAFLFVANNEHLRKHLKGYFYVNRGDISFGYYEQIPIDVISKEIINYTQIEQRKGYLTDYTFSKKVDRSNLSEKTENVSNKDSIGDLLENLHSMLYEVQQIEDVGTMKKALSAINRYILKLQKLKKADKETLTEDISQEIEELTAIANEDTNDSEVVKNVVKLLEEANNHLDNAKDEIKKENTKILEKDLQVIQKHVNEALEVLKQMEDYAYLGNMIVRVLGQFLGTALSEAYKTVIPLSNNALMPSMTQLGIPTEINESETTSSVYYDSDPYKQIFKDYKNNGRIIFKTMQAYGFSLKDYSAIIDQIVKMFIMFNNLDNTRKEISYLSLLQNEVLNGMAMSIYSYWYTLFQFFFHYNPTSGSLYEDFKKFLEENNLLLFNFKVSYKLNLPKELAGLQKILTGKDEAEVELYEIVFKIIEEYSKVLSGIALVEEGVSGFRFNPLVANSFIANNFAEFLSVINVHESSQRINAYGLLVSIFMASQNKIDRNMALNNLEGYIIDELAAIFTGITIKKLKSAFNKERNSAETKESVELFSNLFIYAYHYFNSKENHIKLNEKASDRLLAHMHLSTMNILVSFILGLDELIKQTAGKQSIAIKLLKNALFNKDMTKDGSTKFNDLITFPIYYKGSYNDLFYENKQHMFLQKSFLFMSNESNMPYEHKILPYAGHRGIGIQTILSEVTDEGRKGILVNVHMTNKNEIEVQKPSSLFNMMLANPLFRKIYHYYVMPFLSKPLTLSTVFAGIPIYLLSGNLVVTAASTFLMSNVFRLIVKNPDKIAHSINTEGTLNNHLDRTVQSERNNAINPFIPQLFYIIVEEDPQQDIRKHTRVPFMYVGSKYMANMFLKIAQAIENKRSANIIKLFITFLFSSIVALTITTNVKGLYVNLATLLLVFLSLPAISFFFSGLLGLIEGGVKSENIMRQMYKFVLSLFGPLFPLFYAGLFLLEYFDELMGGAIESSVLNRSINKEGTFYNKILTAIRVAFFEYDINFQENNKSVFNWIKKTLRGITEIDKAVMQLRIASEKAGTQFAVLLNAFARPMLMIKDNTGNIIKEYSIVDIFYVNKNGELKLNPDVMKEVKKHLQENRKMFIINKTPAQEGYKWIEIETTDAPIDVLDEEEDTNKLFERWYRNKFELEYGKGNLTIQHIGEIIRQSAFDLNWMHTRFTSIIYHHLFSKLPYSHLFTLFTTTILVPIQKMFGYLGAFLGTMFFMLLPYVQGHVEEGYTKNMLDNFLLFAFEGLAFGIIIDTLIKSRRSIHYSFKEFLNRVTQNTERYAKTMLITYLTVWLSFTPYMFLNYGESIKDIPTMARGLYVYESLQPNKLRSQMSEEYIAHEYKELGDTVASVFNQGKQKNIEAIIENIKFAVNNLQNPNSVKESFFNIRQIWNNRKKDLHDALYKKYIGHNREPIVHDIRNITLNYKTPFVEDNALYNIFSLHFGQTDPQSHADASDIYIRIVNETISHDMLDVLYKAFSVGHDNVIKSNYSTLFFNDLVNKGLNPKAEEIHKLYKIYIDNNQKPEDKKNLIDKLNEYHRLIYLMSYVIKKIETLRTMEPNYSKSFKFINEKVSDTEFKEIVKMLKNVNNWNTVYGNEKLAMLVLMLVDPVIFEDIKQEFVEILIVSSFIKIFDDKQYKDALEEMVKYANGNPFINTKKDPNLFLSPLQTFIISGLQELYSDPTTMFIRSKVLNKESSLYINILGTLSKLPIVNTMNMLNNLFENLATEEGMNKIITSTIFVGEFRTPNPQLYLLFPDLFYNRYDLSGGINLNDSMKYDVKPPDDNNKKQ